MNDIISVLRNEFSNIYLVDCKSQQIEIYRYKNQAVGVKEILQTKQPYKAAIQKYIEENVVLEDRKKMNAAADFEHVCSQLHKIPQFTVHYRVKRDGGLSYYYMKCARIGDADTFQRVIFAFANEDADVKQNEIEKIIHADITTGKRKILIIEDNALNREMLCEILKDKYDILTAENGESGFDGAQACGAGQNGHLHFSQDIGGIGTRDRNRQKPGHFLKHKKELTEYGYWVGKISMKEQTVTFNKL